MRTPTLEESGYVTDTAFMKKLASLRSDVVHAPVKILHPVLTIAKNPVVKTHQLSRQMVRFFNRTNDPNRVRFTVQKPLHSCNNRGSSRAMSATRVRRNYQYLGITSGRSGK